MKRPISFNDLKVGSFFRFDTPMPESKSRYKVSEDEYLMLDRFGGFSRWSFSKGGFSSYDVIEEHCK